MKKKAITYIVSDVDKAVAFEWIATWLDPEKFALSFLLLNPGPSRLEEFLKERNIPVTTVLCRGKKDWLSAWWTIYRYLKQEQPDIVHCHLLQANILGLSAAKKAGIKKRIYTRHHSSLHHVYHRKGIFWDKRANNQATDIIAISRNVKNILINWEGVPEMKVHEVPHGFLFTHFRDVDQERISAFKAKNGIENNTPVIGVIARFTQWKGVQFIVPAFEHFIKVYPDAVLLLLNAKGDYYQEIVGRLERIPPRNYRLIPFEPDIAAALHSMDIFVHVPVDAHSEAFGQTYIEALAAKVPSVFTLSGIAADFVIDGDNAIVVPFEDSDAVGRGMIRILSDPILQMRLKTAGWDSIQERFSLRQMIAKMEEIYTG